MADLMVKAGICTRLFFSLVVVKTGTGGPGEGGDEATPGTSTLDTLLPSLPSKYVMSVKVIQKY